MEKNRIGQKIRQARTEAHLTQEEVGEKLFVVRERVSAWENGRSTPSVEQLAALSKCFGVPVGYFFEEKTVKPDRESLDWILANEKNIETISAKQKEILRNQRNLMSIIQIVLYCGLVYFTPKVSVNIGVVFAFAALWILPHPKKDNRCFLIKSMIYSAVLSFTICLFSYYLGWFMCFHHIGSNLMTVVKVVGPD